MSTTEVSDRRRGRPSSGSRCTSSWRPPRSCSARAPNEFGAEPNTNVCPVCLGLPGSLPVLNERVVEFALRLGEAFGFSVPPQSIFHRKNYFYPDMPKDYQVSQYDAPICVDGTLDGRRHGDRHRARAHGGGHRQVAARRRERTHRRRRPLARRLQPRRRAAHGDREPPRHPLAPSRRAATCRSCAAVLEAIGVSDVKMEEGSMRVDANVSIRPAGSDELAHQGRDQEHELAPLARPGDRLRDRAADRDVRDRRADRAGDPPLGRGRRASPTGCARRRARRTTATSPSPTSCRSRPTTRCAPRRGRRSPSSRPPAGRRLVAEWGIADHEAEVLLGEPGLADYAEAAVAAGAPGTRRDELERRRRPRAT